MNEATSSRMEGRGDPPRSPDATLATVAEPSWGDPGRILGTQGLALLGLLAVAGIVATSALIQSHVSATQEQAASNGCTASGGSYLQHLDALVQGAMLRYAQLRGNAVVARASSQPD